MARRESGLVSHELAECLCCFAVVVAEDERVVIANFNCINRAHSVYIVNVQIH